MRSPARTKYRKQQKGRNRGAATRATELSYGDYGLQALGHAWLSARVIEAARVAMTRRIKRSGQIWVRPFPDKPVTSKPAETRMGKGKGAPEGWVAIVKPGQVLYEMECSDEATAVGALALASSKLPGGLPLRILRRQDQI